MRFSSARNRLTLDPPELLSLDVLLPVQGNGDSSIMISCIGLDICRERSMDVVQADSYFKYMYMKYIYMYVQIKGPYTSVSSTGLLSFEHLIIFQTLPTPCNIKFY